MGARSFKDLDAWRAADVLRRSVIRATADGPVSKDFYQHKEFAQFLSIARGSLAEVQDHILAGEAMAYWDASEARRMEREAEEALRLAAGLMRHLRRSKAP